MALTLLLTPAMAQAQTPYGYFGVDLLGSELTEDDGAFQDNFDDRSAGLRINAGYRASRLFGFEGALQVLGEFDTGETDLRYSAASVAATLYLPFLGPVVEPYARIGGGIMTVEQTSRFRRSSDSKPMGTAGLGLQFNITEEVALRLGADAYAFETRFGASQRADGSLDRAEQVISTAHAGLKVKF
ncbi:MAG: porin family protein [Halomonadaceae bacterium]|nr:MAG: porin family protein [Halomonadaceae bacterium]